jgi:hypothetical protein
VTFVQVADRAGCVAEGRRVRGRGESASDRPQCNRVRSEVTIAVRVGGASAKLLGPQPVVSYGWTAADEITVR